MMLSNRRDGSAKEHRSKFFLNRGQSTIETAFLLLPFLLLVGGIIEFGWYFLHQHTLQFATREGMRLALVGQQLQADDGSLLTREASIIATIKEHASGAMDPKEIKVWIYQVSNTYKDPEGWEVQAPVAGDPGSYMRVKVRHDHRFLIPLVTGLTSEEVVYPMWAEGTYRNELFDAVS